jgi:hypothetical protein
VDGPRKRNGIHEILEGTEGALPVILNEGKNPWQPLDAVLVLDSSLRGQ